MEQNQEIHDFFTEAKATFASKFPYVAILFLLIVCMVQCKTGLATASRQENNNKVSADSIKYFKNRIGTLTASVGTYKMTAEEFANQVALKDKQLAQLTKEFHTVSQVDKFTAQANIDSINVPFKQPIAFTDNDTLKNNFSRSGSLNKDWLTANYHFNNKGFTLSNLQATIGITTITGFKKSWFLGRNIATTDVTSNVQGVTIIDLKSTTIVVPKRFYETNAFLIGTGFVLRSLIPVNIKF
jgi:hypothetical protein